MFAATVTVAYAGTAFANTSLSDSYEMSEMRFGNGAMLESCSQGYCAQSSIGDVTANGPAAASTATFTPAADNEPRLEVIVDPGLSNLGTLTTEEAKHKTTIVRVSNYLAGGYIMQVVGNAPKFGNHTLATSNTPAASIPGTEQFGINVVSNTTPTVGNNPIQVPAGQALFGDAAPGYNTPNRFKYASEDIIGRSHDTSGRTDYTISMIVNVSNRTPAGHYAGDFAVLVTPVY